MRHTGRDHVVIRLGLLQYQVHSLHVVGCMPPVAPGFEVSEAQLRGSTGLDAGHGRSDFSGHELVASAGTLVVKKDAARAVHPVSLTVVTCEIETGDLADAVG